MRSKSRCGKFGNAIIERRGQKWDSGLEYCRGRYLEQEQKAGHISELRRQVPYKLLPSYWIKEDGTIVEDPDAATKRKAHPLERSVVYKADFVYVRNSDGKTIVEDVKGFRTKEYIIKRKLMLYRYGIVIREVFGAGEPIEKNKLIK